MEKENLGELLLALRRKLAKSSRNAKLRDELSVVQFDALWHIAVTEGATMDSVANHLGIRAPSATTLVSVLEQKKLVNRTHNPQDRRVVNISLTPTAKRQLASLKENKSRAFDEMLENLSATDRRELTRILKLLVGTKSSAEKI
jgi:DNA-binding MarR family transcriptional regulator